MAYTSTRETAPRFSLASVTASLSKGLSRFLAAMIENSAGSRRLRRVEELQAKSDMELAAMGIRRDRIVHLVFRDAFYI